MLACWLYQLEARGSANQGWEWITNHSSQEALFNQTVAQSFLGSERPDRTFVTVTYVMILTLEPFVVAETLACFSRNYPPPPPPTPCVLIVILCPQPPSASRLPPGLSDVRTCTCAQKPWWERRFYSPSQRSTLKEGDSLRGTPLSLSYQLCLYELKKKNCSSSTVLSFLTWKSIWLYVHTHTLRFLWNLAFQ